MSNLDSAINELTEKLNELTARNNENASLLAAITECNPCMIWAKDKSCKYIFANGRHKEWLGIPQTDSVYGKDDFFFEQLNRKIEPDNPRFHDFGITCSVTDELTLKELRPIRSLEIGVIRGKYCALQVYKAPLFDYKGVLIGTVGSAIDITERIEIRESILNELRCLIEEHGLREPFKPLYKKFEAYCDRHKLTDNNGTRHE